MLIWKNEGIDLGKGNSASETQHDVKQVLKKFQEGYTRREVSEIDFYMEELFSKDSDTLVVGTADSEWCVGINDIKRLIESDWKYWGDLKLDVEGAIVSSYGEVAWLTTEGVVSSTSSAERYLSIVMVNGSSIIYIFPMQQFCLQMLGLLEKVESHNDEILLSPFMLTYCNSSNWSL